jgi:hypothetical protein
MSTLPIIKFKYHTYTFNQITGQAVPYEAELEYVLPSMAEAALRERDERIKELEELCEKQRKEIVAAYSRIMYAPGVLGGSHDL